jgi:hypothetical protein
MGLKPLRDKPKEEDTAEGRYKDYKENLEKKRESESLKERLEK